VAASTAHDGETLNDASAGAYTRTMRHVARLAATALLLLTAPALLAQTRMKPTAPGTVGDPVWQGIIRHPDGRTFVTDGGLVIDAALARPSTLPSREFPSTLLDTYFGLSHTAECGFADLKAATSGKTYATPSGLALNATYVEFLRRILPSGSVRLRMSAELKPVIIVADGRPVGALMPVKQ